MTRSVVLLGGPDSGKSNYVGRLWPALDASKGALIAAEQPEDITFVLELADHLFQGHFVPRTEEDRRNFEIVVASKDGTGRTAVVVPDVRGELWQTAVQDCETDPEWMAELKAADGALLFVRFGSELDVRPLDWVTSQKLLSKLGPGPKGLPTQVMLCELLRFLEVTLVARADGSRPRVSVVVGAWDLVDPEKFAKGPKAYLDHEYPMFGGRLDDISRLDVRVFGLSVVGGDLKVDTDVQDELLEAGLDGHGWVAVQSGDGGWRKDDDLTLPVAWVAGS